MFYFCKNVFLLTKKKKRKKKNHLLSMKIQHRTHECLSDWSVSFCVENIKDPEEHMTYGIFPPYSGFSPMVSRNTGVVFSRRQHYSFIDIATAPLMSQPRTVQITRWHIHQTYSKIPIASIQKKKKKKNLFGLCMTKPYKLLLFCINIFLIFIFFLSSFSW